MAVLALFFAAALVISVLGGALMCWLTRDWDFGLRLILASLVSTLIVAPVPAGVGHGAALLPLSVALSTSGVQFDGVLTAAALLITWPIVALAFIVVGRVARPRPGPTDPRRQSSRERL